MNADGLQRQLNEAMRERDVARQERGEAIERAVAAESSSEERNMSGQPK